MRFGGHETFAIREGWLHKGLKLLVEEPQRLVDEHSADWLGVGKNMAKSIRHWLHATGLSQPSGKDGRKVLFEATDFGGLIYEADPYFMEPGTWWAIHVHLVSNPNQAASWSWFFNGFNLPRFERATCFGALQNHLELTQRRPPSLRTLQRDIACLLNTYSKTVPIEVTDPEEGKICPLTELGLLRHFRVSGFYQVNRNRKDIPSHLLGYCVSRDEGLRSLAATTKSIELTFQQAAHQPNSPGRVFALSTESLFDYVVSIEAQDDSDISISGLAGDRILKVRSRPPLEWLTAYFEVAIAGERDAA